MEFSVIAGNLSLIPFLAGRTWLTAFLIALMGRIVNENIHRPEGMIAAYTLGFDQVIVGLVGPLALPGWLIGNAMLMVLGTGAVFEDLKERSELIRSWLEWANTNVAKPVIGFGASFGLLQGQGLDVVEHLTALLPSSLASAVGQSRELLIASAGPLDIQSTQASTSSSLLVISIAIGLSAVVAIGVLILAGVRNSIVNAIETFDDGSLGLMRMFRWVEASWSLTGAIVILALPFLALGLALITVCTLVLLQRWFEHRDAQSRRPCAVCATPIYPTALHCLSCRQPNDAPRQVGVFGQPKAALVQQRDEHRLALIARKRCPFCATRLKSVGLRHNCTACGTVTFSDISDVNIYLRALDKKMPATVAVCFVLGLVPLLGLVPGIVYYRLSLIASLRGYLPRGVGCVTRWGVRLASALLVSLQWIPGVGAIMLPLLCLLNYTVYRKVFHRTATTTLLPASVVAAPVAVAGPTVIAASLPAALLPNVATDKRFCQTCGAARKTNANFCTTCGAPFNG